MTRKRRRTLIAATAIAAVYLAAVVIGQRRLAWAAIDNLADAEGITSGAVTIDRRQTSISRSQERYLTQRLAESPVPTRPRIHVNVVWNALVCARVKAGQYTGPTGAEWKDTLFLCVFGAWVPVYTFSQRVS